MTLDEDESHMAMWCVLAAPLIVGCDMTKMTQDTLRILTSPGALAVDQDKLGVQGTVCFQSDAKKTVQVWRRPLSDGSVAVVALNRGMPAGTNVTIDLSKCGHSGSEGDATATTVTDVWTGKVLGSASGSSYTTVGLGTHGHAFLKLSKAAPHTRCMRSNNAMERMALACPVGSQIVSMAVWWGDTAASATCGDEESGITVEGAVDRTAWLSDDCLGQQSCSFEASEQALGEAPMAGARLVVRFGCA